MTCRSASACLHRVLVLLGVFAATATIVWMAGPEAPALNDSSRLTLVVAGVASLVTVPFARMAGKRLLVEHGIEIAAGAGPLAGQIWRIGVMGGGADREPQERLVRALALQLGADADEAVAALGPS